MNMGIECQHDQPCFPPKTNVIGSPKWFYRFDEFDPVVQMVRHPLSYANTQVRHQRKQWEDNFHVQYPYGELPPDKEKLFGSQLMAFNKDPIETDDLDMRDWLHILMVWFRVMDYIENHPKVVHRFRIEDIREGGEEFRQLVNVLGYELGDLLLENIEWNEGFTHNPDLPPPWERKQDIPWPDVGDNKLFQEYLQMVQHKAKEYGYGV
jgi:hypothetical protein